MELEMSLNLNIFIKNIFIIYNNAFPLYSVLV